MLSLFQMLSQIIFGSYNQCFIIGRFVEAKYFFMKLTVVKIRVRASRLLGPIVETNLGFTVQP